MEGTNFEENLSVEGGEVAIPQDEVIDENVNNDNAAEEEESIDNEGQASEENEDENSGIDNSKAFAQRLSQKTKQIEQQMQAKYERQAKLIENEAKRYGLSVDEYLEEMEAQAKEAEEEAQRQADIEKYGELPDEILEKVKKADLYEQQDKWNKEAMELKKAFPHIKSAEDIPDEVFLEHKNGIPLVKAYKAYLFDHPQKTEAQLKIEAEQAAIKKLSQNSKTSPGLLGNSGNVNTTKSISQMTSAEFEQLMNDVKAGKVKSLN